MTRNSNWSRRSRNGQLLAAHPRRPDAQMLYREYNPQKAASNVDELVAKLEELSAGDTQQQCARVTSQLHDRPSCSRPAILFPQMSLSGASNFGDLGSTRRAPVDEAVDSDEELRLALEMSGASQQRLSLPRDTLPVAPGSRCPFRACSKFLCPSCVDQRRRGSTPGLVPSSRTSPATQPKGP